MTTSAASNSTSLNSAGRCKQHLVHYLITVIINRALEEAANLSRSHKQKLPESISREDLMSFNLLSEFDVLRSEAPMLYNVVAGAMGLHERQLQVIIHCSSRS